MNNSALIKVIKREFERIAKRKTLYVLSIFLPIILFGVLALIYKNKVVTDLPVAVIDYDNSEISRMLVRAIDATSSMNIAQRFNSLEEAKAEFRRGNIEAVFLVPKNFSSDLKSGNYSNISVYKNSSSVIIGTLIYRDAFSIIKTFSGGVQLKKLLGKNLDQKAAMNLINPIRIEVNSLYNPNYNYLSYLIPGLTTSMLQMIIMIVGVLVLSSEFTHKTFHEVFELADKNLFILLLGKSIPHLLIHLSTGLGILGILFPMFDIQISGKAIYVILFLFFFIITSFAVALFISSIFHKQLLATEVALFINTPAFIFSGFTFPLWGMPAFHNLFAQLIPFTHFLSGFLKLYQMNAPLNSVIPDVLKLGTFLVISLLGTIILLNKNSRKALNDIFPDEAIS